MISLSIALFSLVFATDSVSENKDSTKIIIQREEFTYVSDGRRDPFASLLNTSEIRPLMADLRLTGIAYDPSGHNSVAIFRDLTTKEQYRVKQGQLLGRMRVTAITPKSVTFTIVELGYSRQETITMGDSLGTRKTP